MEWASARNIQSDGVFVWICIVCGVRARYHFEAYSITSERIYTTCSLACKWIRTLSSVRSKRIYYSCIIRFSLSFSRSLYSILFYSTLLYSTLYTALTEWYFYVLRSLTPTPLTVHAYTRFPAVATGAVLVPACTLCSCRTKNRLRFVWNWSDEGDSGGGGDDGGGDIRSSSSYGGGWERTNLYKSESKCKTHPILPTDRNSFTPLSPCLHIALTYSLCVCVYI